MSNKTDPNSAQSPAAPNTLNVLEYAIQTPLNEVIPFPSELAMKFGGACVLWNFVTCAIEPVYYAFRYSSNDFILAGIIFMLTVGLILCLISFGLAMLSLAVRLRQGSIKFIRRSSRLIWLTAGIHMLVFHLLNALIDSGIPIVTGLCVLVTWVILIPLSTGFIFLTKRV